MDEWAAHEMEAAPDIRPSPEIYRKLEEKQKKTGFWLFSWPVRLAAAGIAAALIILVIVLQPPKEAGPFVELRKGKAAEEIGGREELKDSAHVLAEAEEEEKAEAPGKMQVAEEAKKEERMDEAEQDRPPVRARVAEKKAKPKETDKETLVERQMLVAEPKTAVKSSRIAAAAPAVAERIEFQYQPAGTETVQTLDVRFPQEEIVSLSSRDNYRLTLQLTEERYVYVFQVGAAKQLTRLFPNTEYSPAQNPLRAGKPVIIPLPPNWLYVEKDTGEVQIYVVDSAGPLHDWEEIYEGYSQTAKTTERRKIANELVERLEKNRQSPEDRVSVHVFKFKVH